MNRISDAQSYFIGLDSSFTSQYREIRRKILAGENEKADKLVRRFVEYWGKDGYIWAGEAYIWLEEFDSAFFYLSSVDEKIDPEFSIPRFQACLALSARKTSHNNLANAIIRKLTAISDSTSAKSPDFFTGWYYSGIGEYDSAFIWLERALENRSPEMPWLKVDPVLKNLKNDDRYIDLYIRTGHKAYDEYITISKQQRRP